MRPSKLTPHMVEVFKSVMGHGDDIIMLTDQELCFLINDQLEPDEQISFRTFQRYKAMVLLHDGSNELEREVQVQPGVTVNMEVYETLHAIWMRCRIEHKRNLYQKINEKVDGWHRYKWLLQRKFPEFRDKEIEINGMSMDELLNIKKEMMPDFLYYSSYNNARLIFTEPDPTVPGGQRYFEEEDGIYTELPHYHYNRNCGCKYDYKEPEEDDDNPTPEDQHSE